MKQLTQYILEQTNDQASIAFELENSGLQEGVEFKFDKGILMARDNDSVRKISDALVGWIVEPKGVSKRSGGFIIVSVK